MAGLDRLPRLSSPHDWTRERVLDWIRAAAQRGRGTLWNSDRSAWGVYRAARRYFGSWKAAFKAASASPPNIGNGPVRTRERILELSGMEEVQGEEPPRHLEASDTPRPCGRYPAVRELEEGSGRSGYECDKGGTSEHKIRRDAQSGYDSTDLLQAVREVRIPRGRGSVDKCRLQALLRRDWEWS